eukprot:gene20711-31915_t
MADDIAREPKAKGRDQGTTTPRQEQAKDGADEAAPEPESPPAGLQNSARTLDLQPHPSDSVGEPEDSDEEPEPEAELVDSLLELDQLTDKLSELQATLQEAVASQDFVAAWRLQKEIEVTQRVHESLTAYDTRIVAAVNAKAAAAKQQRYIEAELYKDEIQALKDYRRDLFQIEMRIAAVEVESISSLGSSEGYDRGLEAAQHARQELIVLQRMKAVQADKEVRLGACRARLRSAVQCRDYATAEDLQHEIADLKQAIVSPDGLQDPTQPYSSHINATGSAVSSYSDSGTSKAPPSALTSVMQASGVPGPNNLRTALAVQRPVSTLAAYRDDCNENPIQSPYREPVASVLDPPVTVDRYGRKHVGYGSAGFQGVDSLGPVFKDTFGTESAPARTSPGPQQHTSDLLVNNASGHPRLQASDDVVANLAHLIWQSTHDSPHRSSSGLMPEVDPRHRRRLLNFYQKYNPSKLPSVTDCLKEYRGHEDKLFAALAKKYGPEPPD